MKQQHTCSCVSLYLATNAARRSGQSQWCLVQMQLLIRVHQWRWTEFSRREKEKEKMEKEKDIKEKTERAKMVSRTKAKQRVANNIAILRLSFRSREGSRGLAIPKEKIKTVTKEKDMAGSQILAGRGRRLCWTCGGNHKAENSWKNRNVVEEQQNSGEMHQGSSHPQSQSSNSQAASSHQPSSAGNNASSNASTSYRVSRIAYADTDTCADELSLVLIWVV